MKEKIILRQMGMNLFAPTVNFSWLQITGNIFANSKLNAMVKSEYCDLSNVNSTTAP